MVQKLSYFEKIAAEFVKLLEKEGVKVNRVILYGSHARGTAREDSDVDLVIIAEDLKKHPFPERLGFLSRTAWKFNEPLEVIGYTPQEVEGKEGKSIFWDEICATGKVIYKAA